MKKNNNNSKDNNENKDTSMIWPTDIPQVSAEELTDDKIFTLDKDEMSK